MAHTHELTQHLTGKQATDRLNKDFSGLNKFELLQQDAAPTPKNNQAPGGENNQQIPMSGNGVQDDIRIAMESIFSAFDGGKVGSSSAPSHQSAKPTISSSQSAIPTTASSQSAKLPKGAEKAPIDKIPIPALNS